jgi:hypothetical protein
MNMSIDQALHWLQDLSFPTEIRESAWLFPTIETVHVFALVLVVGSIIRVDLRLLGVANRERPFSQLAREMLPWTWTCFAIAATAGLLMFTSKAVVYYGNNPFRVKMLCLALAGLNMAIFHGFSTRQLGSWDSAPPPPRARLAGGVSLFLWTMIVAAGRWVGFTT